MSKFHSTVSRRDFMKGLGLAGAGLGAAAAAAPVFHDLDEAAASTRSGVFHEWWVKERDHLDPPIEIEWSMVKPWARNHEPSGTKDILISPLITLFMLI